mmetsp:Transcript_17925/g.23453  ORF Transcript_17925/g.23453 Transcript_17925/m.23453 type:complete len:219 (-) Transcript_17925:599-1255(-)
MSARTQNKFDFEFHILAQSWAPSFCCKKPHLCATLPEVWSSSHLCLHGLWPAYFRKHGQKQWPSSCETVHKFAKNAVPSLALAYAPAYHGGLAKHEWKEHGTCSGLSAEDYFKEALRTMLSFPRMDRGTPKVLMENIGGEVDVKDLRKAYPKQVGIKVTKDGVLEEITSCWSKREDNGKVGHPIDCPEFIMKGYRNNVCKKGKCRKTVKVAKLGQCSL